MPRSVPTLHPALRPPAGIHAHFRAVRASCAWLLTLSTAHAAFPAGIPVSPFITGQNFWLNPPDSAYPIIKESGVTMIRIGGKAYDDNPLSDAALLRQVDNIRGSGAEPLIQVSRHKSAAVAAATVTYLNLTHGRAVKFWSIGNEPDMEWTGTEAALAAHVAGYTRTISAALRDVEPSIHISTSDMAFYSTAKFEALLGGASDITGRDARGRLIVDAINFHRYPFNNVITRPAVLTEMHSLFESRVSALVDRIAFANTLHRRTGTAALTWGLTEYNLTYNNPPPSLNHPAGLGVSSFLNGQFFAEYYRVGMKYGVHMMTTWSLAEGGGNGSSTDFGYIGGSWAAPIRRSSFHHMQMVANHLLPGDYLPSRSSAANLAVLSTSTSGRALLAVMLLNEDTTGRHAFTLRLNDDVLGGAGPKVNVSAGLDRELAGSLENQSTAVLVFDETGALRQKVTYSLARYQLNLPPLVETFAAFTAAPAAPIELTAAGGDAPITLEWRPSYATGYNVKRATGAAGPYATIATGVLTTHFTDTGLTPGTRYSYVVSGVNPLGESPDSRPVDAVPRDAIAGSAAFEAESLSVTAAGRATSVVAESAASGGSWVQLNATAADPSMDFTTGAIPAGTYRLQLAYKANNNRGQASIAVDGAPVGPIIDQYAAAVGFTTVTVGSVTLTHAGPHTIRLRVAGRNAASSGFLLSADRFAFLGPESAALRLGDFSQLYDGSPKAVSVQTTPTGLPVTLTYNGATTAPTAVGNYRVGGSVVSENYFGTATGTLTIATPPPVASRLSNVALRTTLAANQILTVGLTMQGGEKPVLVRAAGPSLAAFGIAGAMPDPALALFDRSTRIVANDNWAGSTDVGSAITAAGAFPFASAASLDAALVARIDGGRTLQISGPAAGQVLVEAYDAGPGFSPRLTNLSALNFVGTGGDILIAGFTITGTSPRKVLLRAAGPSLSALGVSGALADPELALFTATTPALKMAGNDNYASSLAPIFTGVGAFAFEPGARDAALIVELPPGGYTVQVSGANGGTGVALVELYELP